MSPIISTAKFLDVVVPQGNRYIGFTDGQASPSGREIIKCSSFEKGLQGVTRADGVNNRVEAPNLYFALASFKEKQVWDEKYQRMKSYRKQENVDKLKALWLDVDFKMYDSPKACVQDIERFLIDFPAPTFMVNSGGGIHLYWVFEEELTVIQWMPLAMGLAAIAKARKLRADYGVTIDPARVLRLPGYANPKYAHKPVCEIKTMGNYAHLGRMDELLRPHADAVTNTGISVDSNVIAMFDPVTHNEDLSGGYTPNRRSFFAAIATECGVVKDSLANGGNGDSYQLWKDLLHLAAFTEDGDQFAHQISKGDSRYDEANVDEFYGQSVALKTAGTRGPTTCTRFSTCKPDTCAICPHAGKIKSPWMLGVPLEDKFTRVPSFVRNGITFTTKMVANDEGEQEIEEIVIAPFEMDNWTLIPDTQGQLVLHVDIKNGKSFKTVPLEAKALADARTLKVAMVQQGGVGVQQKQAGDIIKVAMEWTTHLSRIREGTTYKRSGWNNDGKAFVLGETAITAEGTERVSNETIAKAGTIATKGAPEPWLELAQAIIDSGNPAMPYILCAGLSAPLMGTLSFKTSMALSIYSIDSGAGKSTVLQCVRAAFGPPRFGSRMSDTHNAIIGKMGAEQGIPAIYDEVREDDDAGEKLIEILFQMSEGVTKDRMDQHANLRERYDLNTVMLTASNWSIADYLAGRHTETNAGFARFIEIELQPRSQDIDTNFEMLQSKLNDNYGHFGPKLIQAIVKNRDALLDAEKKVIKLLEARRRWKTSERYWMRGTVKVLITGMLLNKLGLRIDTGALIDYAMEAIEGQKKEMERGTTHEDQLLGGIIDMYAEELLITDKFARRGPGVVLVHAQPMRGKVKVHIGVEEKALRMTTATLNEYAKKKGFGRKRLEHKLKERFNAQVGVRVNIGGGAKDAQGRKSFDLGIQQVVELDLSATEEGQAIISSWTKEHDTASTSSQTATHGSSTGGQP